MKNIAALILTYNEENIISKCLDALDLLIKYIFWILTAMTIL